MAKGTSMTFLLHQIRSASSALTGGSCTFYSAGTTSAKTVYLDRDMQTVAANPYTLDSNASAQLFGEGLYRIVVKSALGSVVYDWDNVYVGVDPDNVPTPVIPAAPGKNLANNGSFALWSNGTSFTRTTITDTHTADGWYVTSDGSGAGSVTVSQQTFAAGVGVVASATSPENYSVHYTKVKRTSALTGSPTYERFACRIPDVGRLSGKELTFRCYAKATTNPVTVYWSARQDFGSGGSASPSPELSADFTVATGSWQKISTTDDASITLPSVLGKTIGTDSYTEIGLLLPVGGIYEIDIANVMIEFGDAETDFEWLRTGEDFMRANGFGTGTPVFSSATLTVASPSAPLTVTSTTKVANLNSDLLDGQEGSWYTPSGMIAPFAMASPPAGWLTCDGAAVSRATYAALFSAISTTYGAGDGVSTFNLPDLRGMFIRGLAGSQTTYDSGRTLSATVQADANKAHTHTANHTHTITDPSHNHTQGDVSFNAAGGSGIPGLGVTDTTSAVTASTTGITVNTATVTTSSDGSESRPVNLAMLYCIKI